jgi:PleD family two-component response regulator
VEKEVETQVRQTDRMQVKQPGAMSWTLDIPTGGKRELKQTRVLLADDHARIRAGIRQLLSNLPDIRVVGEAGDG